MSRSFRFGRVLVAVALLLGVTPGVDEALEQVAHLLRTGHIAHLTSGETDLANDLEHGCLPNAHACGCCATVPVVVFAATPWAAGHPRTTEGIWASVLPPRNPPGEPVFRPPIVG